MRVNSLTTRYLLALVLCTALPFLGFGLYVRGEVRDREETQAINAYLPGWADGVVRKIAATFDTAVRRGWHLAKLAEFALRKDAETDGTGESLLDFEELVERLSLVNRDVDMVVLANEKGEVLSVTRSPGLDAEKEEELELLEPTNVWDEEWFQAVREGTSTVAPTPRHRSPYLHRNPDRGTVDPTNYSVGISFAVHTPRGRHGALYVLISWKRIQQVIDETRRFLRGEAGFESAEVFLCDPEGRFLAHSERGQDGKTVEPEALAGLAAGDRGGFIYRDARQMERGLGFARTDILEFKDTCIDWQVGVHATTAELFEVSREFGQRLLLIVPVILLLVVGLAYLAAHAIIEPVRRLSEATRQISQGNLDTRVDVRGGDELSDLGRAFNIMAHELEESRGKLVEAERQSAWAEMARQIAHEIKNPLTPMRMSAQMMQRARREGDARFEELADRLANNVLDQTDALDRIASDFRQFAGSPDRKVSELLADDLLLGIQDLVGSMTEAESVELTFAASAGEARVRVDLQEMRRVFLNLIHNAIQATGRGGRIQLAAVASATAVEFRVEDDGPGVPAEQRSKLFVPYFTTKTSGTGLGLAICRRILEAHGGRIQLEASEPRRTVFLLVLPRVSAGDPDDGQISEVVSPPPTDEG